MSKHWSSSPQQSLQKFPGRKFQQNSERNWALLNLLKTSGSIEKLPLGHTATLSSSLPAAIPKYRQNKILFSAVECLGIQVQEMWNKKVAAEFPSVQILKGLYYRTCKRNWVSSYSDGWIHSMCRLEKAAAIVTASISDRDSQAPLSHFLVYLKKRMFIFKAFLIWYT